MIKYFNDLPKKQKIGFICLVIAGLGFVFSLVSNALPKETVDESIPSPAATSRPSATASATPTATPTATSSASSMPEIKYGENKISVSEIRELQDVADKALVEFLAWNANETADARTARISPYFIAGSDLPTTAPDFASAGRYKENGGQAEIVSFGSVDYINPVGGDESTYRITMGTVLRAQYNYDDTGNEKSSVIQTSSTMTVDMTKVDGSWKIKAMTQS